MKKRVKIAVNNPVWDHLVLGRLLAPRLLAEIATERPLQVLEVGCGRGGSTRLLLQKLPLSQMTATDVDPEQVAAARRYLPDGRAYFSLADHASLPFSDGSFDLLVEFNTLHHVAAWRQAVAEAWRVLKPGGRWAIAGITRLGLANDAFRAFVAPQSLFTAGEFKEAARSIGFEVEKDVGNFLFMRFVLKKPGTVGDSGTGAGGGAAAADDRRRQPELVGAVTAANRPRPERGLKLVLHLAKLFAGSIR